MATVVDDIDPHFCVWQGEELDVAILSLSCRTVHDYVHCWAEFRGNDLGVVAQKSRDGALRKVVRNL